MFRYSRTLRCEQINMHTPNYLLLVDFENFQLTNICFQSNSSQQQQQQKLPEHFFGIQPMSRKVCIHTCLRKVIQVFKYSLLTNIVSNATN
jgi:hypothetical protein